MITSASDLTSYGDRIFSDFCSSIPSTRSWRLLLEHRLDPELFGSLQLAAATYISSCLGLKRVITDEAELLEALRSGKSQLPNMTPNGLLRPKWEHTLEFNALHKGMSRLFNDSGLAGAEAHIHSFQMPTNLRIVEGVNDDTRDNRPFATAKLHSDVWVGEPLDAVICHLPLFGDPVHIGIEFEEIVPEHEFEYMKVYGDYNDPAVPEDQKIIYDVGMQLGSLYFADARLLHRTMRTRPGFRISMDFRFRLRCEGEYKSMSDAVLVNKSSRAYAPYSEWSKLGSELFVVHDETCEEARSLYQKSGGVAKMPQEHRIVRLADQA